MLFVYAELFINLIFRTSGPVAELVLIGCRVFVYAAAEAAATAAFYLKYSP